MTPEEWERISEILEVARGLQEQRREDIKREVCAVNPELRSEVDSLLSSNHGLIGSEIGLPKQLAEKIKGCNRTVAHLNGSTNSRSQ